MFFEVTGKLAGAFCAMAKAGSSKTMFTTFNISNVSGKYSASKKFRYCKRIASKATIYNCYLSPIYVFKRYLLNIFVSIQTIQNARI